ncbi:MAG: DUF3131 domain-containing protein [Candidatus Omnitrophica bacterium]|nr:DUF3131 domain-containing protein [Candidatus Omnitrophota bacterium]
MMARRPPLFAAGLLLLSACTSAGQFSQPPLPSSLYNTLIPAGKTPRFVSSFFLIDDFNARENKTLLDRPWQIETPEALRFDLVPHDSFHAKRGNSLLLRISQPPRATGLLKSDLKGTDLSAAHAVVLKCEIKEGTEKTFSGRLEMELADLPGKTAKFDFTRSCLKNPKGFNGWREVIIPRGKLSGLDWSQLHEIRFLIRSGAKPLTAEVALDEIAFYGPGDVALQSKKDNLAGFPSRLTAPERVRELLVELDPQEFLREIARDTWKYFENALDQKTRLPVDHLRVGVPGDIGTYTTPTNLAMYFLACVAANELGFITREESVGRIQKTFETLERMQKRDGSFYNFYDSNTLEVTRRYVSVVDSGWLSAAWMVVKQAYPRELGEAAGRFLKKSNFREFYDPSNGQLRLGFDETQGNFSPFHYGLLATEARVASFIGIGKGDLPRGHWWSIFRVPPKDWDWQSQVPAGETVSMEGVPVFEGFYSYEGKKFVPSWGGSLFEFLMPALVLKEKDLAPQGLGLNNQRATEIHIDYALQRQKYPVWGISPVSVSSGKLWRYGEYGVKYLGVKGYRDEGIIAPYASFLALETLPDEAVRNLRRMLELYEIYGEYGFYDSVSVRNSHVNTQYLILDQGMSLAAIANYLKEGVIQEYFHRDEAAQKAQSLLAAERFFGRKD